MGKKEFTTKVPFSQDHVKDKKLVISMLKFEDALGKSDEAKIMYRTKLNLSTQSLTVVYAMHRQTLDHFGFDTSDESVQNYRTIFKTYYNTPTDYDDEVLSSVYYMKNNKCVYYAKPQINIGNKLTNCDLFTLNDTPVKLFDVIEKEKIIQLNNNKMRYGFIGAFSNS